MGANINLISLVVYKQFGRLPKLTFMRLLIEDRTMKKSVCILYDVLVNVSSFIFPTDFMILDGKFYFNVLIILERPLNYG